jgi:hypothetical protein
MYLFTTTATSMTARFRMTDLCTASVAEAFKQGRRIAGVVCLGDGTIVPASVQDAPGVRAWSPPV